MTDKIKRETAIKWINAAIAATAEPVASPHKLVMQQSGRVAIHWPFYPAGRQLWPALTQIVNAAGYELQSAMNEDFGISFMVARRDLAYESGLLTIEMNQADRDLEAINAPVAGPFIWASDYEWNARAAYAYRTGRYFTANGDIVLAVFSQGIYADKNGVNTDTGFRTRYALIGNGTDPTPKAIVDVSPFQKFEIHDGGPVDLSVDYMHYDTINLQSKFLWGIERDGVTARYSDITAYIKRKWGAKAWSAEISWASYGGTDLAMARRFVDAVTRAIETAEKWVAALNDPDFFVPLAIRKIFKWADED